MVINDLKGKVVFLDTAPLIYFIEGHSVWQPLLKKLFEANDNRLFTFITSSITLLEVLVRPIREGREDIAEQYQKILTEAEGIDIYEINNEVSVAAAKLRASTNIKTPDAIQLATAIVYNADYFLTNDTHLNDIGKIKSVKLAEFIF